MTSEVAISVLSAALVAVTVVLIEEDTLGAVKRPFPVIVPALARQSTAVLLVEVSVAANWSCAPATTVALAGIRLIWTAGLLEALCGPDGIPAHAMERLVAIVRMMTARSWLRRRVEVLLSWKPGDDSKNIWSSQIKNSLESWLCDSRPFNLESVAERGKITEDTVRSAHGSACCREGYQDLSTRFRASTSVWEMNKQGHTERTVDLGYASGGRSPSRGVLFIAACPGQSGREENHK